MIRPLTTAIVALALVGCGTESKPGGPGASKTDKGSTTTTGRSADTFTIKVPATETNIARGNQQDITISIDRGSAFREDVTLSFEAPTGITVTPKTADLKGADEKTTVTVGVAADAPVGKHTVKVTGTPKTGTATSTTFVIDVQEKK
jgi:uncharacterized membrane protein